MKVRRLPWSEALIMGTVLDGATLYRASKFLEWETSTLTLKSALISFKEDEIVYRPHMSCIMTKKLGRHTMQNHTIGVWASADEHTREEELAWKIAMLASDGEPVEPDVELMVVNRIIDNAAVAMAALNRSPVIAARDQALAHSRHKGATLFGMGREHKVHSEWAAWANGTAVRELDFHDTFLHLEFGHPGDNICPLLAVAQQMQIAGADIIRGIATAYEVHVALMRSIQLHAHKIDHVAHTGVATVAGIGAMMRLKPEITYQAINQTLHVCCSTRQSRKGLISSWKSAAPAHSSKLAVEAVDRAMRGESAPSPIYEGEDSVIAWLLGGAKAEYQIELPNLGEPKRAILQTWTKQHSAEYQGQAFIDLAFKMRERITNLSDISEIIITTNRHSHYVIGSGADDPQKYSPDASRETLDHSLPYIFAVALEDGKWHHEGSYSEARAHRAETQILWKKIRTEASRLWERRYLSLDPKEKAFGGAVRILFKSGEAIEDEILFADAHPQGAKPFQHEDYIAKFITLSGGVVSNSEQHRFVSTVENLGNIQPEKISEINPVADICVLKGGTRGIF